MFCMTCGTAMPSGAATCPKCGAAAAPPAPVASPAFAAAPMPYYQAPPPRPSSGFPWILVLGIGCFVFFVIPVLAALLIPALAAARTNSRAVGCRNDLKQIGIYVDLYQAKFKEYPPDLQSLWRPDMATDPVLFICPVTGSRTSVEHATRYEDFSSRVSYEYRAPEPGSKPSSAFIIAWDRTPHPDRRRCVLYYGGRVEIIEESDFRSALESK